MEPDSVEVVIRCVNVPPAGSQRLLLSESLGVSRCDHLDLVTGADESDHQIPRVILHAPDLVHAGLDGDETDPHGEVRSGTSGCGGKSRCFLSLAPTSGCRD